MRLAQLLAPSTVLLASAELDWLGARFRPRSLARWVIPGLGIILAATGVCRLGHDLGNPYRTPFDRTERVFAHWFREQLSADGELDWVQTDLGILLRPEDLVYGTDQYVCFQRIYSLRHQPRLGPRWNKVSDARPLRCVL